MLCMRYHIETAPIWDAFKSGCECPLCEIEGSLSARLVDQYLNEAVMEPGYRVGVNKYGFCSAHFLKLFDGKNKLGLTLQTQTRLQCVMEDIKENLSARQAAKQAAKLSETLDTCVICSQISRAIDVYYETVARMFLYEAEFKGVVLASKGLCIKHYAGLLGYARQAGKRAGEFVKDITNTQLRNMKRLFAEMESFTDKFDASKRKNNPAPVTTIESTSLPRAINKLRGKIL